MVILFYDFARFVANENRFGRVLKHLNCRQAASEFAFCHRTNEFQLVCLARKMMEMQLKDDSKFLVEHMENKSSVRCSR